VTRICAIVPVYDHELAVAGTVSGVRECGLPVILVDDGSLDSTREIANDFPQVVYYHQENHGLSVARNVGARLATGEIVAYTDSDCVADEHWLRYLVAAMQDRPAVGGSGGTY